MIDLAARQRANAPLNAFIEWDERAAFGDGPLSGVTVGVKANIAVAGLAWTGGLEAYRERIATRDAEVVARLRAAGAAILGTLNMEEAALGAATRNPHYGWTQNPHWLGYTPGGSSGGSGAGVAAGLCDVALGTDTMGSVRIPAAYCGVYAFKPANDRVNQEGLEVADAALDCIGPLARSLDLLEQTARVMSAVGEGTVSEVLTLAGLGGVACEAAVLKAYARACDLLGARDGITLDQPLSRIRFAGFVQVSRALAAHLAPIADSLSPGLARLLTYGPQRSDADRAEDEAVLADTRARLRSALAGGAVLLMPTAPQVAFAGKVAPPANQADFTCLANIAGCPAISIPAGADANGFPIGVQLVAVPGREAGLFALARRLDAGLNGYRQPPHFLEGA